MDAMTIETAATFAARVANSTECPHAEFGPELEETEWLPLLVSDGVSLILDMAGLDPHAVPEEAIRTLEHVLIVLVAGGMAAGRAQASLTITIPESLADVDWSALPDLGQE